MRGRTVAIDIKGQDSHPEVKDSLGMMSNTNSAPMEVISILLPYPHEPIHGQGHYQQHVKKADYKHLQSQKADTTNFCSLKKRTLQLFVMNKEDITNICSLKKRTLQTFIRKKADTTNIGSLKKWTLPTFVVSKSGHYKLS